VVISDIGTEGGEYVSYIASDNFEGSYQLSKLLIKALQSRQWDEGSVDIISIPQKRAYYGKARTAGIMETEEHLKLLKVLGCDIAQGYFFSKPMPGSELFSRIETDD